MVRKRRKEYKVRGYKTYRKSYMAVVKPYERAKRRKNKK